jgi:glycosyltransferase involved in cell wall biosynthesis
MRILHIVAGVPPGGGIAESVSSLCRHEQSQGHVVTLAVVDGPLSEAALAAEAAGVCLVRYAPSFPRALYFSWQMLVGLSRRVRASDVVHVHSNWTFPVWWGCLLARRWEKPYVMSPCGCLSRERRLRSVWKKRLAGWFFDRRCLANAALIHATCEAERHEVDAYLAETGRRAPRVEVVPEGVDAHAWAAAPDRRFLENRFPACLGKRIVLFMGRLDPLKGLDLLVSAWRLLGDGASAWHLLIVGPDEHGYAAQVKKMIERAGLEKRVTLADPLYGDARRTLLNAVDVFVLPTYNENFGIAVAEALACGVPVVTTKGAPWAELRGFSEKVDSKSLNVNCEPLTVHCELRLESEGRQSYTAHGLPLTDFGANGRCGWWVDVGVEPLATALREAMELTDEARRAMGQNGRTLVERKYRWETVAKQMVAVYGGIVNGKS